VAIQVTCLHCHAKLTTDESKAGRKAKCPKCGGVIEIPALAPLGAGDIVGGEVDPFRGLADDDYQLEPPSAAPAAEASGERKPCPMCGELIAAKAVKCRYCGEVLDRSMRGVIATGGASDARWLKVRAGLDLLYKCIVIIVIAVIIFMIGGAVVAGLAGGGGRDDFPAAMIVLFAIGGLVMFGAGIGALVGQVKCTNVPEESGAKGYAVGAIVCIVINFLTGFAAGAAQVPAIGALGNLVSIIGSILFVLFIRQSASFLGDERLASSAGRFLIFGVIMVLGTIAMFVVAAAAQAPALAGIVGLGLVIGFLVGFLWYVRLIKGLIDTIDQRAS
jgi:predicted RNA-binding Zn-ribbon protein involved in translation (DUF1610 family)